MHGWYSVTVWKDIPFSLVALLLTITIWKLSICAEKPRAGTLVALFIWSLLFCLLRSNAYYAYIVCVPFLLIGLHRHWKRVSPVLAGVLIVAAIFRGPVMRANHVEKADALESLAVPLQQISYVIVNDGEITEQQRADLSYIFDLDEVPNEYSHHVVDPIKSLIRDKGYQADIRNRPLFYLKLWLDIGLQNPRLYIDAYTTHMKGYLTPNTNYPPYSTNVYNNDFSLSPQPISDSNSLSFLLSVSKLMRQLPLFDLLFAPGIFVWTLLICCFAAGLRRQNLLPYLPSIALMITCLIASPISLEYRYIYSLVVCAPFFLSTLLFGPPSAKQ